MSEENLRYSREELVEFQDIIQDKLTAARKEVTFIKETLSRRNDSGTDNTASSSAVPHTQHSIEAKMARRD